MVLKVDFNMEAKEMQDKMKLILILQIKFPSFLLLICESNKNKDFSTYKYYLLS